MSAVLSFPVSPAAPAAASVGPVASAAAAGDALSRAVYEADRCLQLAERSFSLGLTGPGNFWLDQAASALEVLP